MEDRDGASYRIPTEELVQEMVHSVMKDHGTIRSQTLLHRLILERLKGTGGDGHMKITPQRLRRIAVGIPGMRLIIHCRESDEVFQDAECPVCGTSLRTIRNQTLYGWTVNTGKHCPRCAYWTGKRMRKPVRYVFVLEGADRS